MEIMPGRYSYHHGAVVGTHVMPGAALDHIDTTGQTAVRVLGRAQLQASEALGLDDAAADCPRTTDDSCPLVLVWSYSVMGATVRTICPNSLPSGGQAAEGSTPPAADRCHEHMETIGRRAIELWTTIIEHHGPRDIIEFRD